MVALRSLLVVGCGFGRVLPVGAVSPVSVVPAVGSEVVALAVSSRMATRARVAVIPMALVPRRLPRIGMGPRRGAPLRRTELRPAVEGACRPRCRLLRLITKMGATSEPAMEPVAAPSRPVHR